MRSEFSWLADWLKCLDLEKKFMVAMIATIQMEKANLASG